MSRWQRRALARTIRDRGEWAVVEGYEVPRVWSTLHPVQRLTLPIHAARHGWKKVDA